MPRFRLIRSDRAFAQVARALDEGFATILLEKSSMGDRYFVLTPRGESIGVIDWSAREPGCPHAAKVRKFMAEHGAGDGLLPGFSQTYALGPSIVGA
jgi:hypothetical protein